MISLEEYRKLPADREMCRAVNGPVDRDVFWTVSNAVFEAVNKAVWRDVFGAVYLTVNRAGVRVVNRAVSDAFDRGFRND